MRLVATAKHKTLNREFKVLEIDLKNQTIKCEGKVDRGICLYCAVMVDCEEPWFRIGDVELTIKET